MVHVCNGTSSRPLEKKYDQLELTKAPPSCEVASSGLLVSRNLGDEV